MAPVGQASAQIGFSQWLQESDRFQAKTSCVQAAPAFAHPPPETS
jgi:hypothetical protein